MRLPITQRVPFLLFIALALVFALKITQVGLMSAYGIQIFERTSAAAPEEPRFKVVETPLGTAASPSGYKRYRDYRGLTPYEVLSVGIATRTDDTVTWMILAGILVSFMVNLSFGTALQPHPHVSNVRDSVSSVTLKHVIIYVLICVVVCVCYVLRQQTQPNRALAGTFFVASHHLPINLVQWSEGVLNLLVIWIGYSPILVSIPLMDRYVRLFEDGYHDRNLCRASTLLVNSASIPVLSTTVLYVTLLLALGGIDLEGGRGFRFALSYSPMKMMTWLLLYAGGHLIVTVRFILRFLRCGGRKVSLRAAELPYKLFWLEFRPAEHEVQGPDT